MRLQSLSVEQFFGKKLYIFSLSLSPLALWKILTWRERWRGWQFVFMCLSVGVKDTPIDPPSLSWFSKKENNWRRSSKTVNLCASLHMQCWKSLPHFRKKERRGKRKKNIASFFFGKMINVSEERFYTDENGLECIELLWWFLEKRTDYARFFFFVLNFFVCYFFP